jgi:urocanate hydratase
MDHVLTVELTELPEPKTFEPGIRRAPSRGLDLNRADTATALANALRYVPEAHHEIVAPEFLDELLTRGRIYGYRFRLPAG